MQRFSWEKCAGIHAFIYEFSVFYFLCLFCLPLFGVCPSSSKEIENAQKTCMRFQHNSFSTTMATAIVVLASDPNCYYGSFNAGSKAFYP